MAGLFKCLSFVIAGLLGSVIVFASGSEQGFIQGPNGRLSYVIHLPRGFDTTRDKCPMVIVMHGVMSHKNLPPVPRFARKLANNGYAVLRFDFNSQGKSEGNLMKCTIPSEIADARAVLEYVRSLPYVTKVVLLGHSQGGVVAGMLAGELSGEGLAPDALVLMAPGAVVKDYALEGKYLGVKCDPVNPPEYVQVYWYKFSREYILSAQTLPIYEVSALYKGPVCIVHGTADIIVPVKYSDQYSEVYHSCEYTVIPNEGHLFLFRPSQSDSVFLNFLHKVGF